jgi:hypothetical protein
MLIAEGGRAKELLCGAEPNRNKLKKISGFVMSASEKKASLKGFVKLFQSFERFLAKKQI